MITTDEIRAWFDTLTTKNVAIDDGGLMVVALDDDGQETGAYIEIGGVPGNG